MPARRLLLALSLFLACCPGTHVKRTYPEPRADEIVSWLKNIRDRAASLKAETKSDFRLGNDRVNLTLMMLATWGGKLRFQALDPNDVMAADLASDGTSYCFVDVHDNCGECGPATAHNVARLIRIPLEPDDVVAVLLGSAPVLPDAQGTVSWDDDGGHEILTLTDKDGFSERVVLDGGGHRWDVLEAELLGPDKKTVWKLRHKDFHAIGTTRVPGASLFEQAGDTVRIQWKEQKLGETFDDAKFHITLQPGLPECGQKKQ